MMKLLALYRAPADTAAFMTHYREIHLPLVEKLPGLVKVEITCIESTLVGDAGNFLLADMTFADRESFDRAMQSPQNAAAAADAMAFAGGLVTLMQGTVLD